MKKVTKTIIGALVALCGLLLDPTVQAAVGAMLRTYPKASALFAALVAIALAVHDPKRSLQGSATNKQAGYSRFGVIAILLVLTSAVLMLTGCPKDASTLRQIATAVQDASVVLTNFQKAEIQARNAGLVPPADHEFIQQSLLTLGRAGKQTDSCIRNAANKAGALACVDGAIATIDKVNTDGGLYLKSPQAKADFQLAMIGAKTALGIVKTMANPPPATPARVPAKAPAAMWVTMLGMLCLGITLDQEVAFANLLATIISFSVKTYNQIQQNHSDELLPIEQRLAEADANFDSVIATAQAELAKLHPVTIEPVSETKALETETSQPQDETKVPVAETPSPEGEANPPQTETFTAAEASTPADTAIVDSNTGLRVMVHPAE